MQTIDRPPRARPACAAAGVAALLAATPLPALAAGGRTYEQLLAALLIVGGLGLFVWALYFFGPLRAYVVRRRDFYRRWVAIVLGVVAIAFGSVSLVLGKTTMGSGTVVRDIEPHAFWLHVKVQLGAGVVLLVLGLLTPPRR